MRRFQYGVGDLVTQMSIRRCAQRFLIAEATAYTLGIQVIAPNHVSRDIPR